MKQILAVVFALSLVVFSGCEGKKETKVIDKNDLEQYNIPEGAAEAAMQKAAASTKNKKSP